ncbi:unnamed protein product [Caenorhabditis nigoni]
MVYLEGERCSFYMVGDYHKIRNDGSKPTTAYELVAFKVDIPDGKCLESAISTLASHTGSYLFASSSGLGITSFGITVSPESYDVFYNYDDVCRRPYRIGISCETCPYRMYSFRGTVSMEKGTGQQATWNQCVSRCQRTAKCILAASNAYLRCTHFRIETFDTFTLSDNYEIDPSAPDYLSIKLINTTPDLNCPADENAVFNNTMLDIPDGECLGSASDTIDSQTGSSSALATDITSIGISVTPESYDVTYNYADACNRPFRTGIPCEKTCPSRMYSFRGTISMENGKTVANGPWNQCVTKCLHDDNCILVASNTYTACVFFGIETFTELTLSDSYEIDSTATQYLAIKMINTTPDLNCPADENAVFSNTMDVTSFLEEGSDHINLHMILKKTGNTVNVEWFEPNQYG